MDTKENYKINRELLDDLLIEYEVPKEYWHNMDWLNRNIDKYIICEEGFGCKNGCDKDFVKAIQLIHKLSPIPLTRLYTGIDYGDNDENGNH